MGLSAAKYLILIEEFERYGCARVSDMGVIMLGPLLIRYGTQAQKDAYPAEDPRRRAHLVPGLQRAQLPAPTSRRCAPRRCSTAITGSSTARRSGPRSPTTPTGSSCWCAPTRAPRSRKASASSWCRWTAPASPCGRSSISTSTTSSARCSSTTCGCRRRTWSARSTRAGPWRRRCSTSSASRSARRSCPPMRSAG